MIAIGETGLDYYKGYDSASQQSIIFNTHIDIAHKYSLPIIVHTREAAYDTASIINSNRFKGTCVRGVIHCFSGDVSFARKVLDLGFYISFSGILTFKKSVELHEVAKYVPLDRVLVETDAPYLAPDPYRGKINEPSYVYYTAQYLSKLRGCTLEDLSPILNSNFSDLFVKAIPYIETGI